VFQTLSTAWIAWSWEQCGFNATLICALRLTQICPKRSQNSQYEKLVDETYYPGNIQENYHSSCKSKDVRVRRSKVKKKTWCCPWILKLPRFSSRFQWQSPLKLAARIYHVPSTYKCCLRLERTCTVREALRLLRKLHKNTLWRVSVVSGPAKTRQTQQEKGWVFSLSMLLTHRELHYHLQYEWYWLAAITSHLFHQLQIVAV
jgi:hypothetical protein